MDLMGFLLVGLAGMSAEDREARLTQQEAEQIALAEGLARDTEKEANLAALAQNAVAERTEIEHGGKKLVFERLTEPPISEQPNMTPTSGGPATEEQLSKCWHTLSLSVTTYNKVISEIRWRTAGGDAITAISNIDFNLLRGTRSVEDDDSVFSLTFAIGNEEAVPDHLAVAAAALGDLEPGSYLVNSRHTDAPENAVVIEGLNALHIHFRENKDALETAAHNREILAEAQRRLRDSTPSEPEEIVIQFR